MTIKLLVGLGNPGEQYAGNRHNVGFMAVDAIASLWGAGPWRKRFQGTMAEVSMNGVKVVLLKPATYMNESGRAVGEAMRFYKIGAADVTVFHDELDLEPGKLRVKTGGGHAGHNGLRSISAYIGSDFRRVRIGIGHPGHKAAVSNYVLHDFSKADRAWLEPLIAAIAKAAPKLIEGQEPSFMNEVARLSRAGETRAPAAAAPALAGGTAPAQPPTPKPVTSGEGKGAFGWLRSWYRQKSGPVSV